MTCFPQPYVDEARARLGRSWSPVGWPLIFPVLLGIMFTLGTRVIDGRGSIDWNDFELYQVLAISVALFVILFCVLYRLCIVRPAVKAASPGHSSLGEVLSARFRALDFGWHWSAVLLGALIILICWCVYIVCLYPGTMWYDTSWQVYEHLASTYSDGTLSDHHPFMLVYLYGAFVELGRALFNDGAAGLFVLVLIQIVGAVVAMSLMCCYMRSHLGVRWGFCLLTLLFFGLFPYMPMMFTSIVKDTLQGVLLIFFCIMFCEVVRTHGEVLRHLWFPLVMIVLGLGIMVSKKTGVYMIAPALVALACIRLRHGGRLLMPLIGLTLAVFMLVFVPRIMMPLLDVTPGGKQEMLAIPIQQVAHEYVEYSSGSDAYAGAFSADDEQLINGFLMISTDDIPDEYDYTIVDPIKDGQLRDESLIPEFMALWARLGLQYPLGHLEAWIGVEAGWISYTPEITVKVASGTIANADFVNQYVSWPDAGIKNSFVTSLFNFPGDIPVLEVLYHQSLWATVLPCFLLFVIMKAKPRGQRWARWNTLLAVFTYYTTMGMLFVCPVSTGIEVARYIMPMVLMAPLMLGYGIARARQGLVDSLLVQKAASSTATLELGAGGVVPGADEQENAQTDHAAQAGQTGRAKQTEEAAPAGQAAQESSLEAGH